MKGEKPMAFNKSEYMTKYLKEKYKDVRFRVLPEEYERYEQAMKEQGYTSMRQFIMAAISEKIERGGKA